MNHAYLDENAGLDGFLQSVSPVTKLVCFIALTVAISLVPIGEGAAVLLWYGAFLGAILVFSRITPAGFARTITRVVPFLLMVSCSYAFVVRGTHMSPWWARMGMVFMKAFLCAAGMTALISTTPFRGLLDALTRLRVPRLIVLQIAFLYRYLFVCEDELAAMQRARLCRAPRVLPRSGMRSCTAMVGVLFVRSYERAEHVYEAMCSRGYQEEVSVLSVPSAGKGDLLFVVMTCAVIGAGSILQRVLL